MIRIPTLSVMVHACQPQSGVWVCPSVCHLPVPLLMHTQTPSMTSGASNTGLLCKVFGLLRAAALPMCSCQPYPIPFPSLHHGGPSFCTFRHGMQLAILSRYPRIPTAGRAHICHNSCAPRLSQDAMGRPSFDSVGSVCCLTSTTVLARHCFGFTIVATMMCSLAGILLCVLASHSPRPLYRLLC